LSSLWLANTTANSMQSGCSY